jgi:hypothetical protein
MDRQEDCYLASLPITEFSFAEAAKMSGISSR